MHCRLKGDRSDDQQSFDRVEVVAALTTRAKKAITVK
jgi:hypothetical protein